jgi:site-specific DNA recombinase
MLNRRHLNAKAVIYCRVSTDDQEKEGTSLETQLDACVKYCQDKGYQVAHKFSETYSGLSLERPQLTELRRLVRANDVDVIIIYCLDRLSRNATQGVILRDELDKHHISLESVTEDIDKSPLGEAITYLRGTFAQIEAEKIRERTMRGKLARVNEGRLPQGTGIGIYGYDWDNTTGKRTIIEDQANIVQKVFTMALQGLSFNQIAIQLNKQGIKSKSGSLWHPLTIRRMVNNQAYIGNTYYGMSRRVGKTKVVAQPKESWILLRDITPPIITGETFKLTQEAIAKAKLSRPIKPNAAYLLTSFIKCSKCGSAVVGTTLNGKYRYYKCRGATPTATRGKICDAGYIKAQDLESSVWHKVMEMLSSPLTLLRTLINENQDQSRKIIESLNKDIDKLRKNLNAYPRKEKNLYDLLTSEAVTKDYVLDAVNNLKKERLNDERQLKLLLLSRKEAVGADQVALKLTHYSGKKFMELVHEYDWQSMLYPYPDKVEDPLAEQFSRKRNLFASIRLEVVADPKGYEFNFTLDGTVISTTYADELSSFEDELEDFEEQHPDIPLKDLLDTNKLLPENTPFAKKVNKLKQNLVTIERTSA